MVLGTKIIYNNKLFEFIVIIAYHIQLSVWKPIVAHDQNQKDFLQRW